MKSFGEFTLYGLSSVFSPSLRSLYASRIFSIGMSSSISTAYGSISLPQNFREGEPVNTSKTSRISGETAGGFFSRRGLSSSMTTEKIGALALKSVLDAILDALGGTVSSGSAEVGVPGTRNWDFRVPGRINLECPSILRSIKPIVSSFSSEPRMCLSEHLSFSAKYLLLAYTGRLFIQKPFISAYSFQYAGTESSLINSSGNV